MPDWKSTVGRLRWIGMMEGVSFLLLVGVAMPLKYLWDMPLAVKYTGWFHGVLFVAYAFAILNALLRGKISFAKSLMAFISSLFPFGPFLIDRRLSEDENRNKTPNG